MSLWLIPPSLPNSTSVGVCVWLVVCVFLCRPGDELLTCPEEEKHLHTPKILGEAKAESTMKSDGWMDDRMDGWMSR